MYQILGQVLFDNLLDLTTLQLRVFPGIASRGHHYDKFVLSIDVHGLTSSSALSVLEPQPASTAALKAVSVHFAKVFMIIPTGCIIDLAYPGLLETTARA